jgi:biopolymer transport protein TolR
MAFGRLERPRGSAPMSDINMTPLIDVMLVLLVIFMLTAPLMTSSLKLDLPKTQGTQPQEPNPQALRLSLLAGGELRWNDEAVPEAELPERLAAFKSGSGAKPEVHLRADQTVPYGKVAQLLGQLQQAGLHRIAFVADPQKTGEAQVTLPAAAVKP